MAKTHLPYSVLLLALLLLLFLAGCADPGDAPADAPAADQPVTAVQPQDAATPETPPTATPSPIPPTPTPQLAALVNGQPILLQAYNDELARYEMAQEELGLAPGAEGTDYRRLVLDALIEKELLRQAAQARGVQVTPQMVDDRLEQLRLSAEEYGGLDAWLVTNKWTPETFRAALAEEMLVENMIALFAAEVPHTTEQVRARYIQVDDPALADSLLAQISEGADFGELAAAYSRDLITAPAGGDLGFFARGSLLVPEVEEVAFGLEPGQVSEVIAVTDEAGGRTIYYIVQVTERDPQRPLSPDMRTARLQEAYAAWLAEQLAAATVVTMLDE